MSARTTETAVRQILDTALTSPQVNAFILDANVWVTEELAPKGLTDVRLEIIERYLACALCRLREVGLKNATMGDITENYQVDANVTDYLLRAAAMDPTGTISATFLASATGKARTATIARVGRGFADDVTDSTT